MKNLLAGYQRFRANRWPKQKTAFETLAQGQSPKALVLTCVDSRLDPAMIFDSVPGEVLTVRNVANLVPPYTPDVHPNSTGAALEFGVRVMKVRHIMVLGHGSCGGVRALLEGAPAEACEFMAPWMSIAEPARARAVLETSPERRQQVCEHEVVGVSLANLMTFPWIAERVASGELQLHGAWFAIYSGELLIRQPDGAFVAPEPDSDARRATF